MEAEDDGKPVVVDLNFPSMVDKKMRESSRKQRMEEKYGPFGAPHESPANDREEPDVNDRGE